MDYRHLYYRIAVLMGERKIICKVLIFYLLFLSTSGNKKTLYAAAKFSGIDISSFSRLLVRYFENAEAGLLLMSKRQSKQLFRARKKLGSLSNKFDAAIIVDSTVQNRSSLNTENSQKFNHGKGYMIGHQWTNIILVIGDNLVPLPPIPFYSRNYCKEHNIEYKTEQERLHTYLSDFNLTDFIGRHNRKRICFIADSGYDNIKLAKLIRSKSWHFVLSLRKSRTVCSEKSYSNIITNKLEKHYVITDKVIQKLKEFALHKSSLNQLESIKNIKFNSYKKFTKKLIELIGKDVFNTWKDVLLSDSKQKIYKSVELFFRNNRNIKWTTIILSKLQGNKKRVSYRVRQQVVYLHKTCKIRLVCSEKKNRPDGRRKYLACSNTSISVEAILHLYQIRWKIEIFHKQVKMHLGFQDVSTSNFTSVKTHVHLVYCSYILLDYLCPNIDKMADKKQKIKDIYQTKKLNEQLQLISQFGGLEKFKQKQRAVIEKKCKLN
jgi:hypothetical protein